jgi:iron complex outermembrane receptor protein
MVDAIQLHQPDESKYLPFTPAPRWNSDLKYELTHDGDLFDNTYVALSMECNLRQNHYYKVDATETATPSYTLLHLSAGTDLRWGKHQTASVILSVNNIFDRAYQNHLSRLKYTDVNPRTGDMGIFNMGRNIIIKLSVPINI